MSGPTVKEASQRQPETQTVEAKTVGGVSLRKAGIPV